MKSWIDLIDDNGWVAREQILGEEARSKVPPEFQTQVPNYANPPTLTMAVTAFIRRLKETSTKRELSNQDLGMGFGTGAAQTALSADTFANAGIESQYLNDPDLALSFLESIYKPLKRHYDWFRRTQRGQIKQYGRKARSRTEGYRWRGRSELHVLTSGMDDYPRGPPHAGELHLDLISWMAFFTRTMKEIAEFAGEKEDAITFTEIEKAILDNIEGELCDVPLYSRKLGKLNPLFRKICIGMRSNRCIVMPTLTKMVRNETPRHMSIFFFFAHCGVL